MKAAPVAQPAPASAAEASRPALSVVVPAYNEATRIEAALKRTIEFLEGRGRGTWEIVVVDDGSTDDTTGVVERLAQTCARVRLVRQGQNRGKGAALRAGVASSRGARVLVMDADLATPIEELKALEAEIDAGAQVATGSRAVTSSSVRRSQSALRVLAGRAGNIWIRLLAVPGVYDTQCGFKLFEGDVARELFARCHEDRFGIDIEVLCMARRRFGYRVAEVGVAWEHRDGSKVKWHDYVEVFFGVPRIVWSVMRR
jgi:dolichyl-phosphate beta-glucosyltransferase